MITTALFGREPEPIQYQPDLNDEARWLPALWYGVVGTSCLIADISGRMIWVPLENIRVLRLWNGGGWEQVPSRR